MRWIERMPDDDTLGMFAVDLEVRREQAGRAAGQNGIDGGLLHPWP